MAEFDSLLAPGIHQMTADELAALAVAAYPTSIRRTALFGSLNAWLTALRARGTGGRCWLDGSFLTAKPEPDDIDLVIFPTWATVPTPVVQQELGALLDKATVRAQYGLDCYIVHATQPNSIQITSYWRGWFGFRRDGVTAKGIAEVSL